MNGAKYSHIPYFLLSNTQKEKNPTLIKVEISFYNYKTRFSVIFFGLSEQRYNSICSHKTGPYQNPEIIEC